ncbi:hypothetical protein QE152_g9005 [Popillia japonica]|uniref:Uncharacterized protein n=1 Tax=Popillia japonica TaxID=7064 RepID=A0AAW1M046_POPJA
MKKVATTLVENEEKGEYADEKNEESGYDPSQKQEEINTRVRKVPAWHADYDFGALALNAQHLFEIPNSYEEVKKSSQKENWKNAIKKSSQKENWKNAMNEEYNALIRNNTWDLVKVSKDEKIIDNKWVYDKI